MARMAAGGGPMKVSPAGLQASAKRRVLGQEAVARVHRLGAGRAGGRDELLDDEVALGGGRRGRSGTASSASSTWSDSRSASEKTATVAMPSSRQARMTRTAISPRLAMRTFSNGALTTTGS